ncbi:MAG TPA: hypothetical protein VF624_01120 [Tepidisphaeraceae bacterium]|jgi:hypothetical protein
MDALAMGVYLTLGIDPRGHCIDSIATGRPDWLTLVASDPIDTPQMRCHFGQLKATVGTKILFEGAAVESFFSPPFDQQGAEQDATSRYPLILNEDAADVLRQRIGSRGGDEVDTWNTCFECYLDAVRRGERQVVLIRPASNSRLPRIRALFAVERRETLFSFDTDRAIYRLDRADGPAAGKAFDLVYAELMSILDANQDRRAMIKALEQQLLPGHFWRR